jgi:hypothetical protein
MEHEHTRVADRTRTYDLYQVARKRNELMRAAYVQPLSGVLYESKLIGGSFRDVYVAVLHDFDPTSGVRIFCGDRVPEGQRADYSTTALCIRGLLPLAQQAGHLFDLALCSLLSLYLARLRSDEMLHGFARRAYGDALAGLQEHNQDANSPPSPRARHSPRQFSFHRLMVESIRLRHQSRVILGLAFLRYAPPPQETVS